MVKILYKIFEFGLVKVVLVWSSLVCFGSFGLDLVLSIERQTNKNKY